MSAVTGLYLAGATVESIAKLTGCPRRLIADELLRLPDAELAAGMRAQLVAMGGFPPPPVSIEDDDELLPK